MKLIFSLAIGIIAGLIVFQISANVLAEIFQSAGTIITSASFPSYSDYSDDLFWNLMAFLNFVISGGLSILALIGATWLVAAMGKK